jgi:hypothetical protein
LKKRKKRPEYVAALAKGADWRHHFLSPSGSDLQAIAAALQEGKIRPVMDGVWDFSNEDDAAGWRGAFVKQFGGRAVGKCVVKMV